MNMSHFGPFVLGVVFTIPIVVGIVYRIKNRKDIDSENLRIDSEFIMEKRQYVDNHPEQFCVVNHGKSMNDVEKTLAYTSKQIGL